MKFNLVKLELLCGKKLTVYSVIVNDDERTLFERFLEENLSEYQEELRDVHEQLMVMATKTGAREQYFEKPEGRPGQDIWDLRDKPSRRLRLYGMRLGQVVIILGGGGPKPQNVRTLQENPKLYYENELMRKISDALTQKILDKEIRWTADGFELTGDFNFGDPPED